MQRNQVVAALKELPSHRRAMFLSLLLKNIGFAARGAYVAAGVPEEVAAKRLGSYNEMAIVVADELGSLIERERSIRSATDFVGTLEEWAKGGDCQTGLEAALDSTLKLCKM